MPSSWISERVGFAGWGAALWLAFVGQFNVVTGRPFESARPFFLAAIAVALISSVTWPALARCEQPPLSREGRWRTGRRASRAHLAALGFGAALVLAALPLTAIQAFAAAATAWLVGITVVVATCLIQTRPRLGRPDASTLALLAITLAAFALRVVRLTSLPPEVHGDEAAIGNEARRMLSGEAPNLFGLGWYQIDEVSFSFAAAFMRLFGNDLFGLRLSAAVQGTASVAITFLFARRLFNTRVAILSACLLSVAEMHLHYSRTGFSYIQATWVTVLLLYLLIRAIDRRSLFAYVLLGIVGGLSLLVYAAARLAPVLAVLFLVHALVRGRWSFVRAHSAGVAIAVVTALILFSPMLVVYARDPSLFNVRTGDISVLSGPGYEHALAAYRVANLFDVLKIQTQKSLEAFVFSGETSLQYGHPAPLLDPWTGAFLVVGAGAFAWRVREPAYWLLNTWLWLSLLFGSVLTVDAPFSPHLTGMLPLLGIYPALYVEAGWRAAERLKARLAAPVFASVAALLAGLALVANVRDYTDVHAVKLSPAGFATLLGNYVRDVDDRYRVYLISRPDTSLKYETTYFLIPDADGADLHEAPITTAQPPTNGKGMAFVVEAAMPRATERLAELRQRFPDGQEQPHRNARGDLLFTSYLVPAT